MECTLPSHCSDLDGQALANRTPLPKLAPFLLHSSSIPSEEEKLSVEKAIQETKTTLSVLDEEIARLRSSLALLESRREGTERHLAEQQAVLSSLRHIPPEILGEIFLYTCSESTISWPRHSHPPQSEIPVIDEIPWQLGAVCSYWRTVLHSLPKLWSTIHVDVASAQIPQGVPTLYLTQRVHRFIETCLTRSGSEPLNFTLKYAATPSKSPEEDDARELTCSVLAALVEVSERWANVTLDLEDLFSFHAILAPARERVPNLHTLYLCSSGQSATTPRPWHAIDAFVVAPRLANLTLIHISHPTHNLRLPWYQLKSLRSKGSNFHEGEFTRLLQQSHSLEEFRTEDERVLDLAVTSANSNTSNSNNSAVHLPSLRSLVITNKGSYISRIFQLITAPSLTHLSIHSRTAYSADHTISMLRRSLCSLQLRSLTLESSRDLEVVWEENYGIFCLLAEVKGVEECVLRVSKAADEIIPRLTVRRGMGAGPQRSPVIPSSHTSSGIGLMGSGYGMGQVSTKTSGQGAVLLPNLRYFSLEDSFCDSAAELKEMLQSRMVAGGGASNGASSGIAQLSKVHLKLSRPAPPSYSELDILKDVAKEKGVQMDILV
ncbi:hypothetical protein H1R20_g6611, partial [Candolleomyces eurysporus]